MKKCRRCEVVFHQDDRTRCLYCDSLLLTADKNDVDKFQHDREKFADMSSAKAVVDQVIKERRVVGLGHTQYLLSSYFKTRTLSFMYTFCRNEFKMGKKFERILIQPINMSSFLILPWVFVDLIDSFFFRFMYSGFCPDCGCKYKKSYGTQKHDPCECEYNQEYKSIVNDIMTGKITQKEQEYKEDGAKKVAEGKKSAYFKLCAVKDYGSEVVDIACIWFSISFIIFCFIYVSSPMVKLAIKSSLSTNVYLR